MIVHLIRTALTPILRWLDRRYTAFANQTAGDDEQ